MLPAASLPQAGLAGLGVGDSGCAQQGGDRLGFRRSVGQGREAGVAGGRVAEDEGVRVRRCGGFGGVLLDEGQSAGGGDHREQVLLAEIGLAVAESGKGHVVQRWCGTITTWGVCRCSARGATSQAYRSRRGLG